MTTERIAPDQGYCCLTYVFGNVSSGEIIMNVILADRLTFHDGHHHEMNGARLTVRGLNVWYDHGAKHSLKDVNLDISDHEVTAFIGPSGCGKSTLLKCLNRIIETVPGVKITGDVILDGESVFRKEIEACSLRRRFGWVAQQPNPFPTSIYTNVSYGARIHGIVNKKAETDAFVESCLRKANLWDEVKDILQQPGTRLSGGQQQRLCIARALSTKPDVILMDEPCSALDPMATAKVEELIDELRTTHAIVIVTHNMQQAARVSQRVAYFHLGELIEQGDTEEVMLQPRTQKCNDYITGRFG
jgi:phosphate transport system ATP-binding protein